jgi:VIT1/CCC1 family predicted Fe2+/Mn2+ transporter
MNLSETDLINPLMAAISSLVAFGVGATIPLVTIVTTSQSTRLIATVIAVLITLCIIGYASATVGGAPKLRAISRVIVGGALAMLITYGIGHLFGSAIH